MTIDNIKNAVEQGWITSNEGMNRAYNLGMQTAIQEYVNNHKRFQEVTNCPKLSDSQKYDEKGRS